MLGILNNDQIDHVLRSQVLGRIGCYSGKKMYVVPVTYVYEDGYLYAHSKNGMKIQMMRKNPNVCFEVDIVENMANWRSVIAWGKYEELKTEKEQRLGLKVIFDRLSPMMISESVKPSHGVLAPEIVEKASKAIVFRIQITEKSGRFEKMLCETKMHHL